jgi:hypothetical protein
MSDIANCHGFKCPVKEKCKRFTARPNDHWQAYFLEPTYKYKYQWRNATRRIKI